MLHVYNANWKHLWGLTDSLPLADRSEWQEAGWAEREDFTRKKRINVWKKIENILQKNNNKKLGKPLNVVERQKQSGRQL